MQETINQWKLPIMQKQPHSYIATCFCSIRTAGTEMERVIAHANLLIYYIIHIQMYNLHLKTPACTTVYTYPGLLNMWCVYNQKYTAPYVLVWSCRSLRTIDHTCRNNIKPQYRDMVFKMEIRGADGAVFLFFFFGPAFTAQILT